MMVDAQLELFTECQAIIFEHEIGEQGTPHLQGYMEFTKRVRMNQIKGYECFARAHLEIARGSRKDNYQYCSKTGIHIVEWHDPYLDTTAEGQENQWDRIKGMIRQHCAYDEIRDLYPETALRFESGLRKWIHESNLEELQEYDGDLKIKNKWLWGPPGVGKSRHCWDMQGTKFNKPCNKWWDGYKGEEVVIIEDMDPTKAQMLAHHMKIWGDRYPFTAEIKGGATAITPCYRLMVTSNYSPEQCFQNTEDLEAIRRRFTIEHWDGLQQHQ